MTTPTPADPQEERGGAGGKDLEQELGPDWRTKTAREVVSLRNENESLRERLAAAEQERDRLRELLEAERRAARLIASVHRADLAERDALKRANEQMRTAIRQEHFRMNGSSVYMGAPQHERSFMSCQVPMCLMLKALDADQHVATGGGESTRVHPVGCRLGARHYGTCDPPEAATCVLDHAHGVQEPCHA